MLSPNQSTIYHSVIIPSSLHRLYKIHSPSIPESSVRRILYFLRNKGLVEKVDGKWRKTENDT